MKKVNLVAFLILIFSVSVFAQLNLPRESARQEIVQNIGDTKITIVYSRPNVKEREVWGKLVPYGEVWRTGANENTTFETSGDLKVAGQTLPKGKYGLHTIPGKDDWTIIFNKVNNEWGSYKYDQKQDFMRILVKADKQEFQETMAINFENVKMNSADVVISWEKVSVPFTIDVGDVIGRALADVRTQMASLKPDDFRTPAQAANWVLNSKMTANFEEALKWIDLSIKAKETFGNLNTKARLLAGLNRKDEAIAVGERAVKIAAATDNKSDLEKSIAEWKASK